MRPGRGPGQLLIGVGACGICRTDLRLIDGEVGVPRPPRILGHQIVGRSSRGGARVGVPWLGWTCGRCRYCRQGRENLCDQMAMLGNNIDGAYAEYVVVPAAELADTARGIAARYAALPAHAAKAAKACIAVATTPGADGFNEEVAQTSGLLQTPRTRELIGAFLAGTMR